MVSNPTRFCRVRRARARHAGFAWIVAVTRKLKTDRDAAGFARPTIHVLDSVVQSYRALRRRGVPRSVALWNLSTEKVSAILRGRLLGHVAASIDLRCGDPSCPHCRVLN